MLMHTKVFGRYNGPEDVIDSTACYTEINVTPNYAQTARTKVKVVDENGNPATKARVAFKLYNYGELYTVQQTSVDEAGCASILTGLGDMVAWAALPDGRYGFTAFTAGKDEAVKVVLDKVPRASFTIDLTLTPPRGGHNLPEVTKEEVEENAKRFVQEDSIRTAYVKTFANKEKIVALCAELSLPFERVNRFTQKACGNWKNLFDLLRAFPDEITLDLLETLTDKDLRDFDLAIMKAHRAAVKLPSDVLTADQRSFIYKYVFSPRIANEMLSNWREPLALAEDEIGGYMKNDPAGFAEWIDKEVISNPEYNPLGYTLSPTTAYYGRRADLRNKGLLFVAACRTYGVPARIDEVTGKVEYLTLEEAKRFPTEVDAPWRAVTFAEERSNASITVNRGDLTLAYAPRRYMENPAYYSHFTLSLLKSGFPQLQNYPEEATWRSTFSNPLRIDAGDYLLTSGTRMADGTVLARLEVFPVQADKQTSRPLVMREDKEGVQVIGGFNAENRYLDPEAGEFRSILSKTGRGYYVTGLIRANHEPTNHILHDIEKLRGELEAWGCPILLLFPTQDEYNRFQKNRTEFTNLPSTLSFGVDREGQAAKDLFGSGLTTSRELPFIVIADTFNRVVFSSQGYTIGIGEQIKQTVGKIE